MSGTAQEWSHKILSQLDAGKPNGAAKSAKIAMRKFPQSASFANLMGMALGEDGKQREAANFFVKSLKLKPDYEDAQENLVMSLIMSEQYEKADIYLRRFLSKRSSSSKLNYLQALSFMRQENPEGVIQAASAALEAAPDRADAYNLRGLAHNDLEDHLAAVADFEQAIAIAPTDVDALGNIALPLGQLNRRNEALTYLERAIEIAPSHPSPRGKYALLLSEVGRVEESLAQYRTVVQMDPMNGSALNRLALSQNKADNEALLPILKSSLKKASRSSPDLPALHLAMGNLMFKAGDFTQASDHLTRANVLDAQRQPYDMMAAEQMFTRVTDLFSSNTAQPFWDESQEPMPIFVVGQPRSGTTLTEMVLSAHPDIHSCGELAGLETVTRSIFNEGAAFDPQAIAKAYRERLPEIPTDKTSFVDKLPANYRLIGFALHTFPNAKIIHVKRDPREVALSMWRSFFMSDGMQYTNNLKNMARVANMYQQYMAHWMTLYPDRIFTIDYKDMVKDVTKAGQDMAAFCGVDYVSEMASPERNKADVKTASVMQVREGVHQRSVGGWRAVETGLQPFINGLDPTLWPDIDL